MRTFVSRINDLLTPLVQPQHQRTQPSGVAMPAELSPGPLGANHVQRRRKLKSTLYFAVSAAALLYCPSATHGFSGTPACAYGRPDLPQRRHEWIERSIQYYSAVMKPRISTETANAQPQRAVVAEHNDGTFLRLATNHYYARFLVKKGKTELAEKVYRRIIAELEAEAAADESCDHAKLAMSTLLLALHVQRTGDVKATRAVFVNFFRRVAAVDEESSNGEHRCSCSAKVLQAYALFEMKNGHSNKSLEIIRRAVRMDEGLSPVLGWKQFRDAAQRERKSHP